MVIKASLAKGLDALLGSQQDSINDRAESVLMVKISQLVASHLQPRKNFNEDSLRDLASTIKEQGVIQPIIVRNTNDGKIFEIIAGERRWRAARLAGLEKLPVIIRDLDDYTVAAYSLIENLQREDLGVIEEAMAYKRLVDEFGLTHEVVGEKVGKSRSEISNKLRLLNLDPAVQEMLSNNLLTYGHAKVLLSLTQEEQIKIAKEIIDKKLNVRDVEKFIQQYRCSHANNSKPVIPQSYTEKAHNLGQRITQALSSKVKIIPNSKGEGRAVIYFNSFDEIEWLANKLEE